ncbi:hypothetical protein E2320_016476 [Naja naja]|nr:hypothetical protein E2320_016476 [Naja naja]
MKGLCLWLALLTCLVVNVYSKIFDRCELASVMQRWGMEGHEGYTLDDWVCLAYFASKVTQNIDGSTEYGIFQINSRSWCADQHSTSRNLCSLSCHDLVTDEIIDDIICVKRAVAGPDGMAGEIIAVEKNCITGQLLVNCEFIVPPTEFIIC